MFSSETKFINGVFCSFKIWRHLEILLQKGIVLKIFMYENHYYDFFKAAFVESAEST